MTTNKATAKTLKTVERQRQALELRKAGATFETIAEALGYSGHAGARYAVVSALKRTIQEPADELRALELARLDDLLQGLWTKAVKGNLGAVDRALKVMERRAKYLGLDAAVRVDLQLIIDEAADRHGLTDSEKQALHDDVARMLAAEKASHL